MKESVKFYYTVLGMPLERPGYSWASARQQRTQDLSEIAAVAIFYRSEC